MDYLNKLISKWMPEDSKRVAVDSHPRLSGIMDTINSTLAHGPETRLPKEFYNPTGRDIIERIGVEEWFSGFKESNEYRALGIGALLGNIVSRMVGSVEGNGLDGLSEVGGDDKTPGVGRGGEKRVMFGLSGCHDTTLAAVLSSLGAFEGEKWPPYTSHIALELFRKAEIPLTVPAPSSPAPRTSVSAGPDQGTQQKSFWTRLFGGSFGGAQDKPASAGGTLRKSMAELKEEEKQRLQDYYVRIRYNDRPMVVPGCRPSGKHLEGDESFCTLVCRSLDDLSDLIPLLFAKQCYFQAAFKEIVDKFTPKHWKQACMENLDLPAFPVTPEPAGV